MTALQPDTIKRCDRHGILSPQHYGRIRAYSHRDLFRALLVRELRARHFGLFSICRIWQQIESKGLPFEQGLKWLLTDGRTVHFIADPDVVLAFVEQRRNPRFEVVPLAPMEERMKLARPSVFRKPVQGQRGLEREEKRA